MGEAFQRQGNRRGQCWISLSVPPARNMLHYIGPHGKPVKSNPGKNLTTFNGNFTFVQSESTSFSLETSHSLGQSSKNNFSW